LLASHAQLFEGRLRVCKYIDPKGIDQDANVYVSKIGTEIMEEDLRQAFQQFGNCLSIKIKLDDVTQKQLSYGYVQFEKKADADRAVAMRTVLVKEHAVEIQKYVPREFRDDNDSEKFFQVINLPAEEDEHKLAASLEVRALQLFYLAANILEAGKA